MTYDFADATPVQVTGTGRKAEPNPFREVIAAIALKDDDKTGKPIAKSFVEKHDKDGRDKAIARIKRLMSNAGEENDPQVTVRVSTSPVQVKGKDSETETTIVFWTVKRQSRPRTASTDQSVAPVTPTV